MPKKKDESVIKGIKTAVSGLIDFTAHQSPAKLAEIIGKKLGLSERFVHYTHIEIRNELMKNRFKEIPFNQRILFLSHCMRNQKKCVAKYNEQGLQCNECGNCQLGALKKIAEKQGYNKVFIVPGGSMVFKLTKEFKPKAIIGVACQFELLEAMDKCNEIKLPYQGVLLSKDGCVNTFTNLEEAKEKIMLK